MEIFPARPTFPPPRRSSAQVLRQSARSCSPTKVMWTIPVSDDKASSMDQEESSFSLADRPHLANDDRMLRTKCAQLQSNPRSALGGGQSRCDPKLASSLACSLLKPDKLQQDYEDLFRSYELLQRDHRAVVGKHKSSVQVIVKLKKEIRSLRLRLEARHRDNRTNYSRIAKQTGGCRKSALEAGTITDDKENVENVDVLDQLQRRLSSAEAELRTLRSTTPLGNTDQQPEVSRVIRSLLFCHRIITCVSGPVTGVVYEASSAAVATRAGPIEITGELSQLKGYFFPQLAVLTSHSTANLFVEHIGTVAEAPENYQPPPRVQSPARSFAQRVEFAPRGEGRTRDSSRSAGRMGRAGGKSNEREPFSRAKDSRALQCSQ